jgi:hypothetical protein
MAVDKTTRGVVRLLFKLALAALMAEFITDCVLLANFFDSDLWNILSTLG